MFKVKTFSNAIEAQRSLDALDRLEMNVRSDWRQEIAQIGRDHPDIGEVTDSINASFEDSWGDSGASSVRTHLLHALERYENG